MSFLRPQSSRKAGFTRADLLAVVSVMLFGFALILGAGAHNGASSKAFFCLNNARQISAAVALYAADNHDLFPPNPDDGNTVPGHAWVGGNVAGGLPGLPPQSATFNPDICTNAATSVLAPFLAFRPEPFTCTADPRRGSYTGSDASRQGKTIPAARSIAMNQGVGTVCSWYNSGSGHSGKPNLPVNGPWLDGSHGNRANSPWATFGSLNSFIYLSAGAVFLTAEEDPWSINDGTLAVIAAQSKWIDYPSVYHDRGCIFSFCDGHAELHKWSGTVLGMSSTPGMTTVASNDPDWFWVQSHASKRVR